MQHKPQTPKATFLISVAHDMLIEFDRIVDEDKTLPSRVAVVRQLMTDFVNRHAEQQALKSK